MGGLCGCCADEKPPDNNTMADHKTAGQELYGMEEEMETVGKYHQFKKEHFITKIIYLT